MSIFVFAAVALSISNHLGALRVFLKTPKGRLTTLLLGIVFIGVLVNGIANSYALSKLREMALAHGVHADAETVNLSFIGRGPGAAIKQLVVGAQDQVPLVQSADLNVSLSWSSILRGDWTPKTAVLSKARITAINSNHRNNWLDLYELALELSGSGQNSGVSGLYTVEDTTFSLINIDTGNSSKLNIASELVLQSNPSQSTLTLRGDINKIPVIVNVEATTSSITDIFSMRSTFDIDADIADTALIGQLDIKPGSAIGKSILSANITANNSDPNYANYAYDEHFFIPTAQIELAAHFSENNLNITTFDFRTDRNDLNFKGSVSKENSAVLFDFESHSKVWHTEELPIAFFASNSNSASKKQPKKKRLFSTTEPLWHKWLTNTSGALDIQIENLHTQGNPVVEANLDIELEERSALARFNIVRDENSTFSANFNYSLDDAGEAQGSVAMDVANMTIQELPLLSDIANFMPAGSIIAAGEFWFAGKTTAEMAADLEGDLYVLVENGELDALAVEVMGADLMEVIRLLFVRDLQQIDIRCAYASVNAESGKLVLEHLLIDSEDTLFSGKGNIDLKKESIGLVFTPRPHDASLFSAVTPVHIKGTLMAPKFRPGKRLYLKLATAAALATLTGPAATLIPFLSAGKGKASENCAELFSDL